MDASSFKDLFSKQSEGYARYRPRYPAALFDWLAARSPGRARAWDCGTGNGQAALELAERFGQVIATDPSQKQLDAATPHARVTYRQAAAERSGLESASCELVAVAQAFHWFDQEAFYAEVRRVLKPKGVVAAWCYALCEISPDVDRVVGELYDDILGPYWEPERRQVEEGYVRASFPFERIEAPAFVMEETWDFAHLIGYIGTWSSYQSFLKKNPDKPNPLEKLVPRLQEAWGPLATRKPRWKLSLRAGRVA